MRSTKEISDRLAFLLAEEKFLHESGINVGKYCNLLTGRIIGLRWVLNMRTKLTPEVEEEIERQYKNLTK